MPVHVSGDSEQASDERPGAAVAAAARLGEPDRYLAALLAPPTARDALMALAAFSAEVARIPFLVSREPAMGDIRLQWWRDALTMPPELSTGSEIADAARSVMRARGLPIERIEAQIDARMLQLDAGPFADEAALRDYLSKAEGAQFALAAHVLGGAGHAQTEAASAAAGASYGLARVLLDLPRSLSLGRVPLAQPQLAAAGLSAEELLAGGAPDKIGRLLEACREGIRLSLDQARRCIETLPRETRVAFLPLALVGTYVRAVQRTAAAGGLRAEARVAPLTRVCRIGLAHWRGRF